MGRHKVDPAKREARGAYKKNPDRAPTEQKEGERQPGSGSGSSSAPTNGRDYLGIMSGYIADVVAGRIPACQYVRLACQRHVDDASREREPDFAYHFDGQAAAERCGKIERFRHIKGRWAARKQRLTLEPWQVFIVCCIFGWKRKKSGLRRFREVYVEVPRKNTKSTMAAAIGNTMLLDDGEFGAEVYAGATSEKQAWEVFGPAKLMLERDPELRNEHGVELWAKSIVKADDNSRFWPVIGKPGDGASPSCALIDEYHEHQTPDLYDTMLSGMGAREQPLVIIITTSGTSLASPCYEKHGEAKRMLEGIIPNDELFAVIYSIDPEDDWMDPKALRKANPNFGVSVDEDFLLAQQRQAVLNTAHQTRFKTKHLNMWCSARDAWMNMQQWQLCGDSMLTREELLGCDCWFAVDLASKSDLSAFIMLFKKDVNGAPHYYAFCHCYLPEDALENAGINGPAFVKWAKQGHLTLTEGGIMDASFIVSEILAAGKKFNPREVVYDPFNATHFARMLMDEGMTAVEFVQWPKNFAVPMDDLLTDVKSGRFHHDQNDMLNWMIANTSVRRAPKGLFSPAKDKVEQKIDGSVALIMARGRAAADEAVSEPEIRWA